MLEYALTAGTLATLFVELVKYLLRRFTKLGSGFDFPQLFYLSVVPFITFMAELLLGYAQLAPMPTFVLAEVVRWGLGVVAAFAIYTLTVAPIKSYGAFMAVKNEINSDQ